MTKKVKNIKSKINKEKKYINISDTFSFEQYGRTILAAVLIILILVAGYFSYQYKNGKLGENTQDEIKEEYKPTEDEIKFKNEYESLNETKRSNGEINKKIEIDTDNNIVYISIDEASDLLKEGSGIIYFGFSACPWCRNALPSLINAMKVTKLDTIYYVNLRPNDDSSKDIRAQYQIIKNKIKLTREASSPKYDSVLESLNDYLEDYTLTNEAGKVFNTGKKVLGAPTIAAVKNGTILGAHTGTYKGHKKIDGALPDLTQTQQIELQNIYTNLILKYLGN